MDSRLYFTLGDVLANVVIGAIVALPVCLLVDPGWNMFIAMLVTMAVGMIVAFLLSIPFSYFFGAMEVMVPTMLTGMVSGMVVGMWGAMEPLGYATAAAAGGVAGLVSINAVWLANQQLRGPQSMANAVSRGGQDA